MTTLDQESGARSINYVEGILEGFNKENFNIEEVIPKTRDEAQILRIGQKKSVMTLHFYPYLFETYINVKREVEMEYENFENDVADIKIKCDDDFDHDESGDLLKIEEFENKHNKIKIVYDNVQKNIEIQFHPPF